MAITDEFRGLPMEELIGAPLTASCKAQYMLAENMIAFIKTIGFTPGTTTGEKSTNLIEFDLARPVDDGSGTINEQTIKISVPLLGLVPIPALLIETVNIDFSMEVSDSVSSKSSTNAEVSTSTEVSWGGWWGAKVSTSITGKVSTNRENTRNTDKTAKYNVNVVARQQEPTEGMSKMMDLFASCVEPIDITPEPAAG